MLDNEEGSQIWTDAKQLEDQVNHAWKTNIATGVFPKPKDEPAPKGKGKKNGRGSTTPAPVPEEPRRSITLNIKPPLPLVKEAAPAPRPVPVSTPAPAPAPAPAPKAAPKTRPTPSPALVPPPPPPAPPAVKVAAPPSPAPPSSSFSAATLAAAMQHVPAASTPSAEIGPPGVNQFSTPAALARPRSPDPGAVAERARIAAADKVFIERFDANLEQWRGPEIQLPPGRKLAGVEGSGWFGQGAPEYEMRHGGSSSWPARIQSVLHAVTEYRDAR
jgi:chromatin structure-remodeling complex subunit RSC1/2